MKACLSLKGIITVETALSGFERFMNICRANKIAIYNIEAFENNVSFQMNAKDFKLLKPVVAKTGCKLKITQKRGIPFFMFRYRKHYCFIIGLFLSILMLNIMSMFLWKVEFDGNLTITDNVLMKFLSTVDITTGKKISDIDCNKVEEALRKNYDEITWASVELSGTKMIVHIKENDGFIKKQEENGAGSLVCAYDGEITSIITRKGTAKVKKGDTVSSGDLLVSSEVIVYNDAKEAIGSYLVSADADIYIKTKLPYSDSIDACYEYKIYTGRKKEYLVFSLFNKMFEIGGNFTKFDEFDENTSVECLKLNESFYLPVTLGNKCQTEYISQFGTYTTEQASRILLENMGVYLKKIEKKGVQIIDTSVTMEDDNGQFVLSGFITVICPAGSFVPIDGEVVNERN